MDEQTIKVLARFTEVGQLWPMGAWVYNSHGNYQARWIFVNSRILQRRLHNEISELEANSRGFFRSTEK